MSFKEPFPVFDDSPPPYSTTPPDEQPPCPLLNELSRPQVIQTGCNTVVISTADQSEVQSLLVSIQRFGPYPQRFICPHCGSAVITQTMPNPGALTWLLSGTLIFIGCVFGCCLIPCCISECQDVQHHCPECKKYLGTYHRL